MNNEIKNPKALALPAALVLVVTLSSCSETSEAYATNYRLPYTARRAVPLSAPPPVKVAVVADQSGSRAWSRTPSLRPEDLRVVIELIQSRGGEIGLGLIRDDSNRSLVRLWIEPPPLAPRPPDANGNPFRLLEKQSRYKQEAKRHVISREAWQKDSDTRVNAFLAAIGPLLDPALQTQRSDVWGALRRADAFLAEDRTAWGGSASCWAVLITDGEDNVSEPLASLASGAHLVVVNGSGSVGKLARLQPLLFESVEAALRHLVAEEQSR